MTIGVHLHEKVEIIVFVAEVIVSLPTDELLKRVFVVIAVKGFNFLLLIGLFGLFVFLWSCFFLGEAFNLFLCGE